MHRQFAAKWPGFPQRRHTKAERALCLPLGPFPDFEPFPLEELFDLPGLLDLPFAGTLGHQRCLTLSAVNHSHDGVEATALSAVLGINVGAVDVIELLGVEHGVQLFLSFIVVVGVIELWVIPFSQGLLELVGVDGILEVGLFILVVLIQLIVLLPEGLALSLPSAGELWLPQVSRKVDMAMILAEDQVESLLDSWEREGRADVGLDELLLFLSQSGSLQHHPAGDLLRKVDLVFRDLSEDLVELGGVLQDRLILLAP